MVRRVSFIVEDTDMEFAPGLPSLPSVTRPMEKVPELPLKSLYPHFLDALIVPSV